MTLLTGSRNNGSTLRHFETRVEWDMVEQERESHGLRGREGGWRRRVGGLKRKLTTITFFLDFTRATEPEKK